MERHVQRGGTIAASRQEMATFDSATPEGITQAINDICEKMAIRVVSVSAFLAPAGSAYPPGPEPINRGPFCAIVVFEEDVRQEGAGAP